MLGHYSVFFTASSQASAALVGLLFVVLAMDVDIEKEFRIKRYTVSETAFISLGGIFIISLMALLPSGILLMAAMGVFLSFIGVWILVDRTKRFSGEMYQPQDFWFGFSTVVVYILLASTSIWILATDETITILNTFCILIAILFVLSLIRAWRTLLINRRQQSK